MHSWIPAALALMTLAACQSPDGERSRSEADAAAAAARIPDSVAASRRANGADSATGSAGGLRAERVIRADGIGIVQRGMTIGRLRAALPEGDVLRRAAPFMVDIAAMPVVRGTDTLYFVLVPAGESSADAADINLIATSNETFRTVEGVGPGSTLAEAAAIYGAPTLSYSINDESREYASLPGLPATIRLRVYPASDTSNRAGVYATTGEYNETSRYDPAARIGMVIVFLR